MAGHLDFDSGKWVEDPAEAAAAEREIDVGDDGLARPATRAAKAPTAATAKAPTPVSPPAERSVDVGGDGLVRPSEPAVSMSSPLTPVERAKLIQFVQGGKGNPTAISAARAMITSASGPAPQGGPVAPQAPALAPAPLSDALSPAQKAVILRARMRSQPRPNGALAMNAATPEGVQ
jgi:hypothetical protein